MPACVFPAPAPGGDPGRKRLPYGGKGQLWAYGGGRPLTAVAEAPAAEGEPPTINELTTSSKRPLFERRALPVHLPSRENVHEPRCTCPAAGARCARSLRTSPIFSD